MENISKLVNTNFWIYMEMEFNEILLKNVSFRNGWCSFYVPIQIFLLFCKYLFGSHFNRTDINLIFSKKRWHYCFFASGAWTFYKFQLFPKSDCLFELLKPSSSLTLSVKLLSRPLWRLICGFLSRDWRAISFAGSNLVNL